MDWDDLRYLLAIAREQSLSGAAATLSVTRTTVGRRLRAIEDRLGVRAFDRTPDGFVATAAGQDLVEVAEKLEGEVLAVEGRVLGRDAQLRGKLRVSTLDVLLVGLHEAFISFLDRYPSVELTVTTPNRMVSLPRREADVVLRLSDVPPEYLVGSKVGRVQFAVYGRRELVERIGGACYDDYPWIGWDERIDTRSMNRWMEQHAPNARIVVRIDGNYVALRHMVTRGIGVHPLPCFEGEADPELVRIGEPDPSFLIDLWLLTLPELRNSSRIRAFMDHVGEALRSRDDLELDPKSRSDARS